MRLAQCLCTLLCCGVFCCLYVFFFVCWVFVMCFYWLMGLEYRLQELSVLSGEALTLEIVYWFPDHWVLYIYVFLIQILGIFTFCMNVCWVRDHHDSKSSFLYLGNLCNYDQHFTASFFFQKAVIPWPYLWHLNIWE